MRKGFQYVDYAILALIVIGILYAIVHRRRSSLPPGGPERTPSSDAVDGVG